MGHVISPGAVDFPAVKWEDGLWWRWALRMLTFRGTEVDIHNTDA